MRKQLPKDFVIGGATAAYQVEGATKQTNMSDEPRLDGILVRHFSFLIKWC